MTTTLRWVLVTVLAGHGLLHLLGVAKGFGWADVSALTAPIGLRAGVLWLLAAALVLTTAVFLAAGTAHLVVGAGARCRGGLSDRHRDLLAATHGLGRS